MVIDSGLQSSPFGLFVRRDFVRNRQRGPEAAIPGKETIAMHTDDRSGELCQGEVVCNRESTPWGMRDSVRLSACVAQAGTKEQARIWQIEELRQDIIAGFKVLDEKPFRYSLGVGR